MAEPMPKHARVSDGVSSHNGEYWYRCLKCGAKDWIASYGTEDQLRPGTCSPQTAPKPLSDEEIRELFYSLVGKGDASVISFARAVLAAAQGEQK
jgi:hypothetical protein